MGGDHASRLTIGRYRLVFQTDRPFKVDNYMGSAWRGAFGHALKARACQNSHLDSCTRCGLASDCIYTTVFETAPTLKEQWPHNYQSLPHPYTLAPPGSGINATTGDSAHYTLLLTLFGHANDNLIAVISALEHAARHGVAGCRCTLQQIEQESTPGDHDWRAIFASSLPPLRPVPAKIPPVPAPGHVLRVTFHTPLRLRRSGRYIPPNEFTFADFFGATLRRISLLTRLYAEAPLAASFSELNEHSRAIRFLRRELRWHDWTRHSARQRTDMQMGGLVGTVSIPTDSLSPFWPYLWLGQWTHAGKGATMGLGRYTIKKWQACEKIAAPP